MNVAQQTTNRINEHRAGSKHFPLYRVGECLYRSEGGIFFAVVKKHGRQHRRSLKTKDREIAQQKLGKYREQLRRLDPKVSKDRYNPTFLDVGEPYLNSIRPHISGSTFIRRESVIRRMRRWFSRKAIRDISRLDCERWATDRWKQKVSSRTFNHELETIKLVFNYAIEHGWLLDSPATGLKRLRQEKPIVLIPSRNEFVTLVNDMRSRTARAADWIEFLAYSGCRTGEASEVRWQGVDFVQKTVRITGGEKGTKNGEGRSIPLFPALEHLLDRMKSALPAPPRPNARILLEINACWALMTV
ncbi:MAG: Tyrosine recombinase XerC [Verrucomicrobiae bacterium]|nr:Tyrosine recombinase XerC [Verrucomicrobiae bacterium]